MISKEQLAAAVAEIRAGLGGVQAAVNTLQSYVDSWDPPEPAAPRIRFAVHKYDNSTPVDFASAHVFDLQRGYSSNTASNGAEIFLYATMVRRPGDKNGYTQFLRPSVVPDSWCAHFKDRPDELVTRSINGGDTLINISHPEWQVRAIANIVAEVFARSADGVYLDEVDWSQTFGWPVLNERACAEFPTQYVWRSELLQFIQRLAGELHANGKKLWINHGANAAVDPQWHNNILRTVDAVNSEFFIGREGVGKSPSVLSDGWEEQTAYVAEAERMGLAAHVRCSSTKQEVVDYAFLSWLAVTELHGSFSASTAYSGTIVRPSLALLDKAMKLGKPTAGYASSAYGYYRQFERGVVRVNPFTVTKNGAASKTGSIVLQS